MRLSESLGGLAREEGRPLYLQLQKLLRDAIADGVVAPDDAIPTERALADEFAVSRITVRKAVDALVEEALPVRHDPACEPVEEGLLTRRRGAGTFVGRKRVEKSFSRLSSFSEDMVLRGRKPHSVWIARSSGAVTPEEALALSLSPGSLVYRFGRVRYADGQSMALEQSTVPAYCLPSPEAVKESLYEALEQTGHRPVRALQRLRAGSFDREQAEALGVAAGSPGLFIERIGFLADGRAAEFTQSQYRGDSYDVVAELHDE